MATKNTDGVGKKPARKTKKEKREDIVLTKDNLLYQPLALAVNGYEATAFQQNVVIAVLRKLRGAIKDMRDGQFRQKPVQLSIFDNEGVQKNFLRDGDLAFDIHLRELGVDTPHYSQAFKAVCTIADAKVWVPAKKDDGTEIMIRKSFFDIGSENVDIVIDPQTGRQTYKYKNRSPVFTLIMSREVVNVLFPNDGRIYDFIDDTALMISEKFPKRIYLYLSNFKYMPDGLTVDYWKFRHDIGFNDNEVDAKTKERIIQYPHYCDFVKRVLRPSQTTLREMADNNISDFYFEYTEIYKTSRRQKNPDQIHFDFHLSDVGRDIKNDKTFMRETIDMERRLQADFDQTPAQVRRIIISLTPDDYPPFTAKMNELQALINERKVQIKDKRSYANRVFTDFIHTLLADKKRAMEKQQSDADVMPPTSTADTSHSDTTKPIRFYTEADLRLFQQVKDKLSASLQASSTDDDSMPNGNIDNWLPEILLYKVEDDTLTIAVPTRAFHESFIHYFGSGLLDRLEAAFSRQVGVCFLKQF
ncbi:MAG: hypothetical protein J1F40_08260 [Prevotellaceae bacterium]|nr:hypothetical protein [Prevotellaceae bacterium]